jgi:hypothetical protein
MGIYHDLTGLTIPPDGPDARMVRGTAYKAAHRNPDFLIAAIAAQPLILTAGDDEWAVPAARTEWKGFTRHRWKYPKMNVDSVRFVVNTIKAGKGFLSVWASNDNGVTWNSLDGASGPRVSLNTPLPLWQSDPLEPGYDDWQPPATLDSGWVTVSGTVRAFADPLLRIVGETGDGATKTKFGSILLYGR